MPKTEHDPAIMALCIEVDVSVNWTKSSPWQRLSGVLAIELEASEMLIVAVNSICHGYMSTGIDWVYIFLSTVNITFKKNIQSHFVLLVTLLYIDWNVMHAAVSTNYCVLGSSLSLSLTLIILCIWLMFMCADTALLWKLFNGPIRF